MSTHPRLLPATAFVLAALVVRTAAADLPPPDDFVETCTAAIQQKPGTECYACGSYHGSVDKCPKLLEPNGLTKACQSYGASVWTEVWCRPAGGAPLSPDAAAEAKPPTAAELAAAKSGATPPGKSGCGACAPSGAPGTSAGALAAIAIALLVSRRRRRAQAR